MSNTDKVLYVIAQNSLYNQSDKIPLLQEIINNNHFARWIDKDFLNQYLSTKIANDPNRFNFNWYPYNAPGRFIAEQVSTPGLVYEPIITLEKIKQLLSEDNYSHIYIAVYLNGYELFMKISTLVRKIAPNIKLIAGANAALLPETKKFVDYCIFGDSVLKMRMILNEPEDQPRKPVIIPSVTTTVFHKMSKTNKYGLLITGFGCRYGCDFCPSTAQWGVRESYPLSPENITEKIFKCQSFLGIQSDPVTLSLAEPQGLANPHWKNIFHMCKDLPFKCNLVTTTSSKVIKSYSIKTLTKGNLRLSTVNIGLETTINGGYSKNYGVNLKSIIDRLQSNGINVVLTYLIGLNNQNRDNILREVEQIKKYGASSHIVANLELQPGTPLYIKYKKENRILDVPPELLAMPGYQAYRHPPFKSGFNDMLPLLDEVNDILDQSQSALGKDFVKQDKYFQEEFKQIDLFHPYILTTN